MAKNMPLSDALAEYLADGMTVAFEGFSHLVPFAAAHEAIRQERRCLDLVRMTPDLIYDQMIGMGCARRVTFSYAGNPGVGLLRRMRDAVENGWPAKLEISEHSHAALANAYVSGASGIPFAVLKAYRGVDLPAMNPREIRSVRCPFSGEQLAAVRSVELDLAVIHAQKADRAGNVLIEGIVGVQKEAVLAAKSAIATVEELVDDLRVHPNACILPSWTIDAVCVVPGGSHPSYVDGYYERDNAAYQDWDRISADRERFMSWMRDNVLEQSPEVFAQRVRKIRKWE
ncbi:MAG: hypothetical protein OXN84_10035 [Albidovulum sp.]|nr:hypothetical protein [Albidovulum sp.]